MARVALAIHIDFTRSQTVIFPGTGRRDRYAVHVVESRTSRFAACVERVEHRRIGKQRIPRQSVVRAVPSLLDFHFPEVFAIRKAYSVANLLPGLDELPNYNLDVDDVNILDDEVSTIPDSNPFDLARFIGARAGQL